jgi:FO synthase subunit 2
MYGHIESSRHKAHHLALIREIQKATGGFTEFVPLSFVHTEAPMYRGHLIKGIRAGPTGDEIIKMHAVSRIMLNNHIPNIQVSWVKEGARMSQMLLSAGANDFGGTLINESISTAAGSQHGQLMRPKEIRRLIRSAGKIPVQRTRLYDKVRIFQNDDGASDCELDKADSRIFGSYHELIQLDKFRYTGLNSPSQAYRSN